MDLGSVTNTLLGIAQNHLLKGYKYSRSSDLIYCTYNTANSTSTVATASTALSTWLTATSCFDILKLVKELLSLIKPQLYHRVHQNLPFHSMQRQSNLGQFLTHFHNIRCDIEFLPASKFPQLGSFPWGYRIICRSISHDHSQCVPAMVMSLDTIVTRYILRPLIFTPQHFARRHRSVLQCPIRSCARSIVLYTQRFNIRTLLQTQTEVNTVSIVIFLKTGKQYKDSTSFNSMIFTPGFNNIILIKF